MSKKSFYRAELSRLQEELVKLQLWIQKQDLSVLVIFEGRDAAGKGGAIKKFTKTLNPRFCRVVALDKPTEREQKEWYFQRYVKELPAKGEIVLFDRSWYNRAGVEHVMGFCDDQEYETFLRQCPQFESLLVESGIVLVKYWFSVSREEQRRRFLSRLNNPAKRWKLSKIDVESCSYWQGYSEAAQRMFSCCNHSLAPWYVVASDNKHLAHLNYLRHFLSLFCYENPELEDLDLSSCSMTTTPEHDEIGADLIEAYYDSEDL